MVSRYASQIESKITKFLVTEDDNRYINTVIEHLELVCFLETTVFFVDQL